MALQPPGARVTRTLLPASLLLGCGFSYFSRYVLFCRFDRSAMIWKLVERGGPWGDYSAILEHGLCRSKVGEPLELWRTGPFVPAVTLPGFGNLVVNEACKRRVESAQLSVRFESVRLTRAVRIDWQSWPKRSMPKVRPTGGEPENYLVDARHDREVAKEIGQLFRLLPGGRYGRLWPDDGPSIADLAECHIGLVPGGWRFLVSSPLRKALGVEAERACEFKRYQVR